MKLNAFVSAGLFAAIATLSTSAQAAAEMDKAAEAKAPVAGMQADKKMKPHSHMEEKTGAARQAPPATGAEGKPVKLKPAQDRSKHFHPRDGKS